MKRLESILSEKSMEKISEDKLTEENIQNLSLIPFAIVKSTQIKNPQMNKMFSSFLGVEVEVCTEQDISIYYGHKTKSFYVIKLDGNVCLVSKDSMRTYISVIDYIVQEEEFIYRKIKNGIFLQDNIIVANRIVARINNKAMTLTINLDSNTSFTLGREFKNYVNLKTGNLFEIADYKQCLCRTNIKYSNLTSEEKEILNQICRVLTGLTLNHVMEVASYGIKFFTHNILFNFKHRGDMGESINLCQFNINEKKVKTLDREIFYRIDNWGLVNLKKWDILTGKLSPKARYISGYENIFDPEKIGSGFSDLVEKVFGN